MTRYIEAFSWTDTIDNFVRENVTERPLLNVCSGRAGWGDVTVDLYEQADIRADWEGPWPFAADAFAAVFCDPPWNAGHKDKVAGYMREALRVAPVAYLMAPWLYGAGWAVPDRVWVRHFPGVHTPVLLTRYVRADRPDCALNTDEVKRTSSTGAAAAASSTTRAHKRTR